MRATLFDGGWLRSLHERVVCLGHQRDGAIILSDFAISRCSFHIKARALGERLRLPADVFRAHALGFFNLI